MKAVDPKGSAKGHFRVFRGHAWGKDPRYLVAPLRDFGRMDIAPSNPGFRIACARRSL